MGHSWVSISAAAFLALTCVFALAKGSVADKLGMLLVLAVDIASDAAMTLSYPRVPEIFLFALDFALAAGLLIIALKYVSLWLGTAMLLQSSALCAHAFRLGGYLHDQFWWMVLNNVVSQLMLVCIIVATAMSWRRRHAPATPSSFILVADAPAH